MSLHQKIRWCLRLLDAGLMSDEIARVLDTSEAFVNSIQAARFQWEGQP